MEAGTNSEQSPPMKKDRTILTRVFQKGLVSLAALILFLPFQLHAAAGDLDPLDLNMDGTYVYAMAEQPDGKIIIAGRFFSVLGVPRNNIARVNVDGTLDTSFDPNANQVVYGVTVQPDGKLLVYGAFTSFQPNGAASPTTRNRIARLNADGTLDPTFDPNANSWVYSLKVQADGKMVIGGGFTNLQPNGATSPTIRNRIARLNADGTLDSSFNPNANSDVQSMAIQPDGKILLVGQFSTLQPNGAVSPTTRNYIARLNTNGTLDATFNPRANNWVLSVAVQPDEKILVAGKLTTLQPNGAGSPITRNAIARLNSDGTVDTNFNPNVRYTGQAGEFREVYSMAVQADGKVTIVGPFISLQPSGAPSPSTRNRVARLNADGTLDGFNPNVGPGSNNTYVYAAGLQTDGRALIGGFFTSLRPNGAATVTTRRLFARLVNDTATQSLIVPDSSQVLWTRGGSSPEIHRVTFESSTDNGTNWTSLGDGVRIGTTPNWQLTGLNLPVGSRIRARGMADGGYQNGSSSLIESVTSFTGQVARPVIIPPSLKVLGDGAFQFDFTNKANTAFSVLATTNVALPVTNWTVLGSASNAGGGIYRFTDPGATNHPRRFYQLSSP